ncbi:FxSxx-COOH system tetratricopeptide repeat protein [Actinosynnema sp. NPDC050801]|uniref:FxSxx-COOH system tetratricopeptide repeat protein n=1 Tax=unclassified Actinosynnema TaxID=2637065 RepID=UPI0033CD3292
MTSRQLKVNAVLVVVVGAALGVVTNFASVEVPEWFKDQSRVWLTFAVLVLLSAVIQLAASRQKPAPPAPPVVMPRFPAVPSALRPPTPTAPMLRGREGELTAISPFVEAPGGRFVVVCGPGGMGKTTLAGYVAERAKQRGLSVFWIRWRGEGASDGPTGEELLTVQMVQVATALGLPDDRVGAVQQSGGSLADLVWGHLERTPGWVLVIDNADRTDSLGIDGPVREHRGWIRPNGAGLLLVTSRDRSPDTWGQGVVLVRLEPLTPKLGGQVLLDLAPDGGSPEEAERLATRLGGLPLALHAAGTAIAQPTARLRRFTTYLDAMDDGSSQPLMSPDVTDPKVARTLVGHTWELSLDQLAAEGLPLARPLLRALALLADAPIPRALIDPGLIPTEDARPRAAAVDAALSGLERYGLVDASTAGTTAEVGTVVLHPLVREAGTMLLTRDGVVAQWRDEIENHLIDTARAWLSQGMAVLTATRLLAPHLLLLADVPDEDRFFRFRDTINAVADTLERAGHNATAFTLRSHVLEAETSQLGPDHPDILASQNNLATVLSALGRYREAEQLHRATFVVLARAFGPEHHNTLFSQSNLAAALNNLGRHGEAEQLLRASLDIRTRTLGPEHPDTLASQNDFAAVLHGMGIRNDAEQLLRATLDIRTRTLGPEHPDTLSSQNNLAAVLNDLGRHREAEQLLRATLDIRTRTRTLGPEHPNTLVSQANLAFALNGLGRHREAEQLLRATLDMHTRTLGPEHPNTLTSQNNLAAVLNDLGRHREAEQLLRATLDIRTRTLGPEHPNTLTSQNNLAFLLSNRVNRREPWWRRLIRRRR